MPIMSVDDRNDARGAASLLASAASDCIQNPSLAPDQHVTLNNVFRLLEAYRGETFFGMESVAQQSDADEILTLMPPAETHLKEVKGALHSALNEAYEDLASDEAILSIEGVLRGLTYPERFAAPSEDQKNKAGQFFDLVLCRLELA